MKKLALLMTVFALPVYAQESTIRILDIQPRYRTHYEQRCHQEQVSTNNSGIGTVIGGVAGGIIGNQVGKGSGNTAATVAGAVVGGMVGNRIGGDQQNVETRQVCNSVPVQVPYGETVRFVYKNKVYTIVTE